MRNPTTGRTATSDQIGLTPLLRQIKARPTPTRAVPATRTGYAARAATLNELKTDELNDSPGHAEEPAEPVELSLKELHGSLRPNGWRVSGEADRVRCTRGLGRIDSKSPIERNGHNDH